MTRRMMAAAVVVACGAIAGCDTLLGILQGNTVTVELVNSGSFPVSVVLYVGENQNAFEGVLIGLGEKIELTVSAGQTQSFTRDCDDLQAIVLSNADLQIIGEIGPEVSTRVYRDGSDFNCGDTLVFTFAHPILPTRLDVDFESR